MSNKIKYIVNCVSMALILFTLSALCLFMPKDKFLLSERRPAEEFPEFTLENVMKDGVEYNDSFMSKFEKYAIDAFPFRDEFRTLKAIYTNYIIFQKDNNNIYLADGQASKFEAPLREEMIKLAASKFKFLYEKNMKGKTDNIYISIIPDKNYFLAEKNGYPSIDYERLNEILISNTDFAEYIDIYGLLSIDEYYTTDTHWRQECITDVADKILTSMGQKPTGDYKENTLDNPFYGVYYGQSALPLPPDTIKYLTNDILEGCKVTIHSDKGVSEYPLYNMDKAFGADPYEMFLSGAVPLVVIENPSVKETKELVIFRDSFGSSISPLLVDNYSKVTIVDIRYIPSGLVGSPMYGINFEGADVLFLYSTLVLNSANILK